MKKIDRNKDPSCRKCETLIIKKKIEGLDSMEEKKLNSHLLKCSHCRDYQKTVDLVKTAIQTYPNVPMERDESIRRLILNRAKSKQTTSSNILEDILLKIKSLFEIKIPVYQAVIGVIILFFLLFLIDLPSNRFMENGISQIDSSSQNQQIDLPYNVIESLDFFLKQKIGKNVHEDSLLTRFIVSSM
jgi:hypothetical protein